MNRINRDRRSTDAVRCAHHILPAIAFCAFLGGCQRETPAPQPSATTTPEPVAEAPLPPPMNLQLLRVEAQRSTQRKPEGESIGTRIVYPQTGHAATDALIGQWIGARCPGAEAGTASAWQCSDQFLASCLKLAAKTPQSPTRCRYEAEIKPVVNDRGILSLSLLGYHYSGGAHGNPDLAYLNIDVAASRVLQPQEIVDAPFETLRPLIEAGLRREQQATAESRLRDIGYVVDAAPPTSTVLIDKDALVYSYSAYEIAPYSMGLPGARIPYSDIDKFIPSGGVVARWRGLR